jgi:hypothetical protein
MLGLEWLISDLLIYYLFIYLLFIYLFISDFQT